MKAKHIREHTDEELQEMFVDTGRKLFDARVKKNIGEASGQPLAIRGYRRELARIKTILRERLINVS